MGKPLIFRFFGAQKGHDKCPLTAPTGKPVGF